MFSRRAQLRLVVGDALWSFRRDDEIKLYAWQHTAEMNLLCTQVPGWQLVKGASGALSLRQEWKVRNFQAGLELFKRIGEVAEAEGHHPDLHLEGYNRVAAVLSTHSVGMPTPTSDGIVLYAPTNLKCALLMADNELAGR